MIDVNVDGKRHLYNGSKHLSGKLEDHQPPSLLQMELQNIDRFWESSRQQVHQEVVTVRDQLEKKERDPGLTSWKKKRWCVEQPNKSESQHFKDANGALNPHTCSVNSAI
ncbi:hypothetical protein DY000_02049766 [Brassica cretica]|uniref:Uncharacterized protein n=1 Tax=Brassica cretica TaxID=69181 RepID=A0ABQ7ET17_BRACR|nr:hypothetical protein DY000_02049766 [Brassica cretica]